MQYRSMMSMGPITRSVYLSRKEESKLHGNLAVWLWSVLTEHSWHVLFLAVGVGALEFSIPSFVSSQSGHELIGSAMLCISSLGTTGAGLTKPIRSCPTADCILKITTNCSFFESVFEAL